MTDHVSDDCPECGPGPRVTGFVSYPLDGVDHTVYTMSDGTVRETTVPSPVLLPDGPVTLGEGWNDVGFTTEDTAAQEAGFLTNAFAFRTERGPVLHVAPFSFVDFDPDAPPPPPATPADLDRAAWDRLHAVADRLRPKDGPRSDGLPPLAVDTDDLPEGDDFLISAGTMQDVEVMCLRKGCTWEIDVERETGHAFPLLSGVLARVERHRRDHGTGR